MTQALTGQAINAENRSDKSEAPIGHAVAKSNLTKLAAWINDRNVPFLITRAFSLLL